MAIRAAVLALALTAALLTAACTPDAEFRGVWVHAFAPGAKTPAEIDQLIERVLAANANAVIVQVGRRGDAYYHRGLQPRTEDPAVPPDFDALQYLIERAHAAPQRIEVHAWLTTLAAWNVRLGAAPASPDHVFNRHGPSQAGPDDWFSRRYDGARTAADDYYLDPGHPDAVDYVAALYAMLARNYEVDGIHLDRVRYPEVAAAPGVRAEWGYNPVAVARFQAATGRTDVPPPDDAAWSDWRRRQVTGLVRKIYLHAVAARPRVKVSAATIPWGPGPASLEQYARTETYRRVLQDPIGWLREGILDIDIPMNYDREHNATERAWFRQWVEFEKDHQYGRHVVIGPGWYLNTIGGSLAQVRAARAPSRAGQRARGVCGYSYQGTNSEGRPFSEMARALTQPSEYDPENTPVFARKVPMPVLPWKTRPARGHLMGTVRADGPPADGLEVSLSGPEPRTAVTDGRGWFGAVDLLPGTYRVSAGGASVTVEVRAGEVAEVSL